MITPSQIYWLAKLDDIRHLLHGGMLDGMSFVACAVSVAVALFVTAFLAIEGTAMDDSMKTTITKCRGVAWKVVITSFVVQLACGIISTFTPSTKQMAAIFVIPRIANSEAVSELGDLGKDLVGLAKEWVEEIRPKNKETK